MDVWLPSESAPANGCLASLWLPWLPRDPLQRMDVWLPRDPLQRKDVWLPWFHPESAPVSGCLASPGIRSGEWMSGFPLASLASLASPGSAPENGCLASPEDLAPILDRLGVDRSNWVRTVRDFGRMFKQAAGRASSLVRAAPRCSRRWFQGKAAAHVAFLYVSGLLASAGRSGSC
jgi:hypothetical protein